MDPAKPRLGTRFARLAIGTLMVLALIPASASAAPARYVYEICDSALPGGGVSGAGFTVIPAFEGSSSQAGFAGDNSCAQQHGALAISHAATTSEESGSNQGTTAFGWKLRNSNSAGEPNLLFEFGSAGLIPVVGDWNGDGIATIGTYEPANGIWRLRNSNSAGPPDLTFQYGGVSGIPVVGDWDGNGTTTIGIYYPNPGVWDLRNSNNSGNPSSSFQYGGSQFKPIAGDWDGNGTTTIGLYEPIQGRWELRNANTGGNPELDFQYGDAQAMPVPGDWNGSGTDTVGVATTNGVIVGQGQAFWSLPIAAPPGGTMASITVTASACRNGFTAAFVLTDGWPLNCQPEQARIFPLGEVGSLPAGYGSYIWLECREGEVIPHSVSGQSDLNRVDCEGGTVSAHYIAVTETDPVPPVLSDLQGSLLSGNVMRGRHDLSVKAHDEGGGLSKVWASVNGATAAQTAPPSCNTTYTSNSSVVGTVASTPTPCPA
ncbi:MAG: hypothetical protein WBM00_10345, partial [Solirubrobacterales bacterium]